MQHALALAVAQADAPHERLVHLEPAPLARPEHAERLEAKGVPALSLGGLEPRQAQEKLREFQWSGGPGFIFTSPERAETDGFLEYLLRANRSRLVSITIDEIHCISQWGHDFRPPYKFLPGFLDRAFGRGNWPTLLGLTATLDPKSEEEILQDFHMKADDILRSHRMMRDNLALSFRCYEDTEEKLAALCAELEGRRGQKIVIYTHLKQNKTAGTRAMADRLASLGHRAAPFDADMDPDDRYRVMEQFRAGALDIVCATGAFGMGIDIPDIRGVIHFLLPESLEQYAQEVGRAGRDGNPAFGILLYAPKNSKVRQDMISGARVDETKVQECWDKLIGNHRGSARTLSPNLEFQGQERDYALFCAFQRAGAIEILARGPARLASFEANGLQGAAFLNQMNAATRIGQFPRAFLRLGLDLTEGYRRLFELYDRVELRLVRSPNNVIVYKEHGLTSEQAQDIAKDVNAKIDRRLAEFGHFRDLVESCDDPGPALKTRFAAHEDV